MTDVMHPIFDARAMPPASVYRDTSTWKDPQATADNVRARGWTPAPSSLAVSLGAFEVERAEAGVVVIGLPARVPNGLWGGATNHGVCELAAQDPASRIWYAAVDYMEPVAAVADAVEQGARGIVVEPYLSAVPAHVDDEAVNPIYDAAQSLGVPVLVMLGGEYGKDLSWCDPARVERVAARFPELDVVVVHTAWPLVQEMVGVAYRQPRVWLLPDVYFPGLPGEADLVLAMRTFLRDRVIYGSGYPFCPHGEQLAAIRALDLPAACLSAFLYANGARLFGLPEPVPTKPKELS